MAFKWQDEQDIFHRSIACAGEIYLDQCFHLVHELWLIEKSISIMFKMGEIHQDSNQIVKKWLCDVPNINEDIYPVTHLVWRISLDINHYAFAQEKLTPSKMKPVFAKLNDKRLSCDDQKIGIWCTYIKTNNLP